MFHILNKDYMIKTLRGSIVCKVPKWQCFSSTLEPFELFVLDNEEKRDKPILRYQGGQAFLYFVCSVLCLL